LPDKAKSRVKRLAALSTGRYNAFQVTAHDAGSSNPAALRGNLAVTRHPMSEATPVDKGSALPAKKSVNLALIVSLIALGVTGWHYLDSRQQLNEAKQALATRLAENGGNAKAIQTQADQALAATRAAEAKLALLEARVNELAGQYATLQSMYLELTRNREDWQQAEVEHALTIASQQLALAGNVKAVISGLEAIDARLASIDKPQYIALRRAISADLIQLKALPHIDRVGLAVRLDQLMAGIDHLPLMVDAHRIETTRPVAGGKPAATPAAAPALETLPPWQGGGEMIRHVSFAGSSWNRIPLRFEAGTPPIAEAIGLAAALEFVATLPAGWRATLHWQALPGGVLTVLLL